MPLAEDEWEELDDVDENGSRMEGDAWVDENGSRMEGDTWMDDNGSRMEGDTWETDSSAKDDMICMENEDCPDGFPVCFLGPYAEVVNAKDTGVALTGRCRSLKCSGHEDCDKITSGTALSHVKMYCIFDENDDEDNGKKTGLCMDATLG